MPWLVVPVQSLPLPLPGRICLPSKGRWRASNSPRPSRPGSKERDRAIDLQAVVMTGYSPPSLTELRHEPGGILSFSRYPIVDVFFLCLTTNRPNRYESLSENPCQPRGRRRRASHLKLLSRKVHFEPMSPQSCLPAFRYPGSPVPHWKPIVFALTCIPPSLYV